VQFWNTSASVHATGITVWIVTGYGMDDMGSTPSMGKRIFFFSVQTGSGAHPAPYPTGNGGSFYQLEDIRRV
jgi:hypothetical protein